MAVLGSERCGKTTWLVQGLSAAGNSRFPLPGQEEQLRKHREALLFGQKLPPTPARPGIAWCIDRLNGKNLQQVYLCDISGLESREPERLIRYKAFEHLRGIAIVLDVLGLPRIQERYGAAVHSMRPPVEPTRHCFGERHLAALLQTFRVFPPAMDQGKYALPVAVILTKLDVMGLWRKFEGDPGGANGALCTQRLEEWGYDNMMRQLSFHFRQVRYFPVHYGSGAAEFSPAGPLLWLIENAA